MKFSTRIIGSLGLLLFFTNCAPIPQNGDPHRRLSSFGEQILNNNYATGFTTPTAANPVIDTSEPDSGGIKMSNIGRRVPGKAYRHSIAPVGDYDFAYIQGPGSYAVSISPTGGSLRVRAWQRASQTKGPSTLIYDRTVRSGSFASFSAALTSQKPFLVTRIEGTEGKRLIYDYTYRKY